MTEPIKYLLPACGILAMIASAVPVYRNADLPFRDCWLSIWAVFFLIGFVLSVTEAYFFSSKPPFRGWLPFGFAFVVTGCMAAVAAWFSSSFAESAGIGTTLKQQLSRHSPVYWAWRFFGAAGLFTFLYGTIGSATWPFIKKCYQDNSLGLELRVPDGRTVIGIQMCRGLVIAIVLFPLLISIPASATTAIPSLALLLVFTMAIGPLTMAPNWPIRLRLIHAIEFTVFTLLYAAVAYWLFVSPAASE